MEIRVRRRTVVAEKLSEILVRDIRKVSACRNAVEASAVAIGLVAPEMLLNKGRFMSGFGDRRVAATFRNRTSNLRAELTDSTI